MESFLQIDHNRVSEIIAYIQAHGREARGFYYGLKQDGQEWCVRSGSTFFGFDIDGILHAVVLFSATGVMTCHVDSEAIYKKLDFLKVMRKFKPTLIKSNLKTLEKIQMVLSRVAVCEEIERCLLMETTCDLFVPDRSAHGMIVDAALIDIHDAVPFLLEVERAFGRNPLSVNQLKEKVEGMDNYVYYVDERKIMGQAAIEYTAEDHAQLGGVYIRKDYRSRGIGRRVTSVMTQRMLDRGLRVSLLVYKDNLPAVRMYQNLGYQTTCELGLMTVHIQ